MYAAKITGALTEAQVVEKVGKEVVEKLKNKHCDFSGRVIDDCFGVLEMTASDAENGIKIHYLIDSKQVNNEELEMDQYDYSNYYFTII